MPMPKDIILLNCPLTGDCLKAYLELPNIHKDPFDHILLAQALNFPMHLILRWLW